MMRIMMPVISTKIVFGEQPFHSLRMIPHTLLNTTLRAMSMQNENVVRTGDEVRKPLPKARPKNWLYHNAPAMAQNKMLLAHRSRWR